MRTLFTFTVAILAGMPHGKYAGELREVPGLSLRGDGCHVELLAQDGALICMGVATKLPVCHPLIAARTRPDGGMTVEKFRLGSSCSPPRLASAALGPGVFVTERAGDVFKVICDDAPKCQRRASRKQIMECCDQTKAILDSPVCKVEPDARQCPELNK